MLSCLNSMHHVVSVWYYLVQFLWILFTRALQIANVPLSEQIMDTNVGFFMCSDSFLGVLSKEDVSSSGEALLYCVGTLKFLSGNSAILRLLLDKNCVGVAQKLIQRLCTARETNFTTSGHILVQVCQNEPS